MLPFIWRVTLKKEIEARHGKCPDDKKQEQRI
jgi:hypothetical protein